MLRFIVYTLFVTCAAERVLRVIDGDTIIVEAPWVPEPLKPEISVRLYGVDTPEMKSRDPEARVAAEKAKHFVENILDSGEVRIEYLKWDKYGGRILGNLFIKEESLAEKLISEGLGEPYFGGAK